MLFSVAGCVNWSLTSRPAASQAESGFSFFSHFRSSSFRWKNSFIIIFISPCESKHGGVNIINSYIINSILLTHRYH